MFWTILDRVVNLTFLLLAVVIITTLLSNSNETAGANNYTAELKAFKQEVVESLNNNTFYIEGRVNRLQEQQDSYQSTSIAKMLLIQEQMEKLHKEMKAVKQQNPNLNVNTNNNVVNVQK